jgi:folate-binding protein YgfZ
MTEAVEQQVRELPLASIHKELGAGFVEEDGWLVPDKYGDPHAEYSSVRNDGAGLIDLSSRGRIRVSGKEALMFMNGLITNDMKTLEVNRWMPAVFPTVQGRLIAAVRVIRLNDAYLLDTETATHQKVLKTIERFTLAGDFHVTDETGTTVQLSLQGKSATTMAPNVLGVELNDLIRDGATELTWKNSKLTIVSSNHTGIDGYDLIVSNESAEELWSALIAAGAQPVGHETLETLRIEAGIARYGRDMDDSNVVTETNLDDAVSFTKGCYIGQEIIIRIKHRGHVAKKLTGLLLQTKSPVEAGTIISSTEGKEIGRVTSSTYSPKLDATLALGYVRYEQLAAGTAVKVGEIQGTVHDLPFVRS